MPINPLIALGARSVDTATPINNFLANRQQQDNLALQTRQVEQGDARLDLQQRQLDIETRTLEENAHKAREESTLVGSAALSDLLDSGDTAAAEALIRRRISNINARQGDPRDSVEALNMLKENPEGLAAIVRAGKQEAISRGLVTPPKAGEGQFTLKNTRFNPDGSVVASIPEEAKTTIGKAREDFREGRINEGDMRTILARESGVQTREQLNQTMEIERFKADLKREDPVEQLKLKDLQQKIRKGELEIQETEETKKKAGKIKQSARELVDELLKDPDSVRAVVGPFDNSFMSGTFLEGSLNARTKIKQLKSILTADNLGIMTGVLSETDLKVISDIAGGGLDVDGSDEGFIEALTQIQKSLASEGVGDPVNSGTSGAAAPIIDVGTTETLPNGVKITRVR